MPLAGCLLPNDMIVRTISPALFCKLFSMVQVRRIKLGLAALAAHQRRTLPRVAACCVPNPSTATVKVLPTARSFHSAWLTNVTTSRLPVLSGKQGPSSLTGRQAGGVQRVIVSVIWKETIRS